MDLFVLVIILSAGFIIKYLIDIISSLNDEIKEIKHKCVFTRENMSFKKSTQKTVAKIQMDLIKNMKYLKNYFDKYLNI